MLEIIAMATMLIDHMGAVFFPDIIFEDYRADIFSDILFLTG